MAYLSDDELLDTEGGFTGWDDETGTGAAEETLEQAPFAQASGEVCAADSENRIAIKRGNPYRLKR